MKSTNQVRSRLVVKFKVKHVDALLKHYSSAVEKYVHGEWDGVALKSGKFVESVTKALLLYCGKPLPNSRHFKAGCELKQLENVNGNTYSDVVRIVIPKACIFVYEIVNNRGGRHDADEIEANQMDAKVVVPIISWVLAEMVRYCSTVTDTALAMNLIDELTNKVYPHFEEINGRSYINIHGLKPGNIALLLLYFRYPERMNRQVLVDQVKRHGTRDNAANTAVHRLKNLVDDDNGEWTLRGIGRQKAEDLLKKTLSGSA